MMEKNMMSQNLKDKKVVLIIIFFLIIAVFITLFLVKRTQDIRKKATGGQGQQYVKLYLDPASNDLTLNIPAIIRIILQNTSASPVSVGAAGVDVSIDANFFNVANTSINCNTQFLSKTLINSFQNGTLLLSCSKQPVGDSNKIVSSGSSIELGRFEVIPLSIASNAEIRFTRKNVTDATYTDVSDDITEGNGIYNIIAEELDTPTPTVTDAPGATITPTLTPTLTPTGSITLTPTISPTNITPPVGGPPTDTPTPTPSPTGSITPSPSPSPTDELTPSPTPSMTIEPSETPVPTPPSGQERYLIDIGSKSVLRISIGSGNTPQITFQAKLARAENFPDMYFKLRAKDELSFIENPGATSSCDAEGVGDTDLYVPMQADSEGVYSPAANIDVDPPIGATVASVSEDGWILMDGVVAGKYYTIILKAPKTRGTNMISHVIFTGGKSTPQDFDWMENGLEPGDLPDPNHENKQDCTVNSVDLSLINSRLGNTDAAALAIADVNYDNVVNANDIAQVVGTLSSKPDDDN